MVLVPIAQNKLNYIISKKKMELKPVAHLLTKVVQISLLNSRVMLYYVRAKMDFLSSEAWFTYV